MQRYNEFNQPIGIDLDFTGPWPRPAQKPLQGQYCRLRAPQKDDEKQLFDAYALDETGKNWTYMPSSPVGDFDVFQDWYLNTCFTADPLFYVITDLNDKAIGITSYLRINERDGSVEVGWIHFSPFMQKTPASTEAMYLMMAHVFDDLNYRRYEWKCDALNAPSRAAATRLGFTFEGVFRQCTHYKGRNRDTAWFSILDHEWAARKALFQAWLDAKNFDDQGRQITPLNPL